MRRWPPSPVITVLQGSPRRGTQVYQKTSSYTTSGVRYSVYLLKVGTLMLRTRSTGTTVVLYHICTSHFIHTSPLSLLELYGTLSTVVQYYVVSLEYVVPKTCFSWAGRRPAEAEQMNKLITQTRFALFFMFTPLK